jgi:hypothetical protein
MSKPLRWVLEPAATLPGAPVRQLAARSLRCASTVLARLSRRLRARQRPAESSSVFFEFHAEAGAPEGALFVDGVRVGTLPGVTRL